LKDNFELDIISTKLNNFYDYEFKVLIDELKKIKINLSLSEQVAWKEFFNKSAKEIKILQTEISKINNEIDKMVYELYGLTQEEIHIVENAVK
ncbi:hypothetical protein JW964_23655, partial [candidate division KSB1 bacterium]|nr:hypothetical protein [candidate division KSB1 bacterium]